MKLSVKQRADLTEFASALSEIVTRHEAVLEERRKLRAIATKAAAEKLEKQGTFDLTDDKEILAHLIRSERSRAANERVGWNETIASREYDSFDALHLEALAHVSSVMAELVQATKAQIADKFKDSVGTQEAERLAALSEPVIQLEKLIESKFIVTADSEDYKFQAIRRIKEVLDHALSDDANYETLRARLATLTKRAKANK